MYTFNRLKAFIKPVKTETKPDFFEDFVNSTLGKETCDHIWDKHQKEIDYLISCGHINIHPDNHRHVNSLYYREMHKRYSNDTFGGENRVYESIVQKCISELMTNEYECKEFISK